MGSRTVPFLRDEKIPLSFSLLSLRGLASFANTFAKFAFGALILQSEDYFINPQHQPKERTLIGPNFLFEYSIGSLDKSDARAV
mmetsp:Transcript_62378/g.71530  ORF Transcript_62378/g.71530 Transcript_62378/m.71530 type:complete len:84 (+) Transcript_62378:75-326(+)